MSTESQSTRTISVIVVEDYQLTRLVVCSALENTEGFRLMGSADNAEKGLELIATHRPDVVLMDLTLPGISGVEATHHIKTHYPDIKVVIYTSHEEEDFVVAALGAGANAYCVKERALETLTETLRSVAEGAAWLDPAIADVAMRIFQKSCQALPSKEHALAHQPEEYHGPSLTEREMEVLTLLVAGKSNTEIAKDLIISVHTAKTHVCNILQKLTVQDRVQAAVKAIQEGLIKF